MKNFSNLVQSQREFFFSGKTRSYTFRKNALCILRDAIIKNEKEIMDALLKDFNKCYFETYMTEIGIVLDEIKFHLKHLKKWIKTKSVRTPLSHFPSRSFIVPEPRGIALIMSPWNYPFQLCLTPLIGAISSGSCAVVKPSAYAKNTSNILSTMLSKIFPLEYIAVVEGGREENALLLEEKFDYIFFTGSPNVGKIVMEKASKNLTPVTLELGGKSPVIIDNSANIRLAARRVAFGKILNAGQTCVAPDYAFVHESVKSKFIEEFKKSLDEFFPNADMSKMNVIINEKHFKRARAV
ncbi:MAG: aldehyde dehydrogenase family protein, partial [Treponema sp.]|nr:aldehyde dehydrogenase family protein [Treponema sp.]